MGIKLISNADGPYALPAKSPTIPARAPEVEVSVVEVALGQPDHPVAHLRDVRDERVMAAFSEGLSPAPKFTSMAPLR